MDNLGRPSGKNRSSLEINIQLLETVMAHKGECKSRIGRHAKINSDTRLASRLDHLERLGLLASDYHGRRVNSTKSKRFYYCLPKGAALVTAWHSFLKEAGTDICR